MTDRKPTFGGGSVPSTEDTKSLAERRSDGKEFEQNDEGSDEEDLPKREYRRVEGGAWSHEDDKSDDPRRIVRKVREAKKEGSKDD